MMIAPHDALDFRADYPRADHSTIDALLAALTRDERSALALDLSLCPLHLIDYAICFDDDDPDCAAIRDCFPNHDT
jgi:hypothetical protein